MLDFRQAPPLSVPLRFFLTAPLFGLLGAAIVLWAGPDALSDRWQPATVAAVHAYTAGFLLQAMVGALWQVLPVVAGAAVPRPLAVARAVHPLLAIGALALVGGLMGPEPLAMQLGAVLLLAGGALFLAATLPALWRAGLAGAPARLLALALAGLGGAVVTGGAAVGVLSGTAGWNLPALVGLHVHLGLAAWALPLVIAVALPFVPMFYMTPPYTPWLGRAVLPLGAAAALAVAGALDGPVPGNAAAGLAAAVALAFAVLSLRGLARRRRPRRDATLTGWQLALLAFATAAAVLLLRLSWPDAPIAPRLEMAFGALALFAGLAPLVGAMQLRILPFLASLHLAERGGGWRLEGTPGPRAQRAQVALQSLAGWVLALAAFAPACTRPGAVLLLLSQLLLAIHVARYARSARRALRAGAGGSAGSAAT